MTDFYFAAVMLWVTSLLLGFGVFCLFLPVDPRPMANVLAAVFLLPAFALSIDPGFFIGLAVSMKPAMPFEVEGAWSISIAFVLCVVFLALIVRRLIAYRRSTEGSR